MRDPTRATPPGPRIVPCTVPRLEALTTRPQSAHSRSWKTTLFSLFAISISTTSLGKALMRRRRVPWHPGHSAASACLSSLSTPGSSFDVVPGWPFSLPGPRPVEDRRRSSVSSLLISSSVSDLCDGGTLELSWYASRRFMSLILIPASSRAFSSEAATARSRVFSARSRVFSARSPLFSAWFFVIRGGSLEGGSRGAGGPSTPAHGRPKPVCGSPSRYWAVSGRFCPTL